MHLMKLALPVLAIALSASGSALASIQVGDWIKLTDGPTGTGSGPGGAFTVDNLSNGDPNFLTFCVEISEHISFGVNYKVAGIGTVALDSGKVLTEKAAWLYKQYIGGLLPDYAYANNAYANAIQVKIWKEVGWTSIPSFYTSSNTYVSWVTSYINDNYPGSFANYGGVRIMNLVDAAGNNRQDQLVVIPEPTAVIVWSLLIGSVGLTMFGRRERD